MAKINHERTNRNSKLMRPKTDSAVSVRRKAKKKQKEWVAMRSKFKSFCSSCSKTIEENKPIRYFPKIKVAIHSNCTPTQEMFFKLKVANGEIK